MEIEAIKIIAAAACMALGGIAPAIAEGMIATKAMEAMGRNPSESGQLFSKMIIAMAITESIAIFSLLISLIIIFVM